MEFKLTKYDCIFLYKYFAIAIFADFSYPQNKKKQKTKKKNEKTAENTHYTMQDTHCPLIRI
jgi:hypothetical protein